MNELTYATSALATFAAILLFAGGIRFARTRETRSRGVLMIVAALVLLMNVMIWTV